MASLSRGKSGRRITFTAPDRRQRTLRLGSMDESEARVVKTHVEHLLRCVKHNQPWSTATDKWLQSFVADEAQRWLLKRLVNVGLLPVAYDPTYDPYAEPADVATLGAFFDDYVEMRRDEMQPRTLNSWAQARHSLIIFFGEDRPIDSINAGHIAEWRAAMLKPGATTNSNLRTRLHRLGLIPRRGVEPLSPP